MAKPRPAATAETSAIMASMGQAEDQAEDQTEDQTADQTEERTEDQAEDQGSEIVIAEPMITGGEVLAAEVIDEISGVAQLAARDREPGAIELYQLPAMRTLVSHLEAHASGGNETDLAIEEIIAQVLSADSLAEILADTSAVGLLTLLDKPIKIHAVKYQRSEYEEGNPWYALMDVERGDNGWRGAVSTGAQTILAQLARFQQLSLFPVVVKTVHASKKPTKSGYWPIRLAEVRPLHGAAP